MSISMKRKASPFPSEREGKRSPVAISGCAATATATAQVELQETAMNAARQSRRMKRRASLPYEEKEMKKSRRGPYAPTAGEPRFQEIAMNVARQVTGMKRKTSPSSSSSGPAAKHRRLSRSASTDEPTAPTGTTLLRHDNEDTTHCAEEPLNRTKAGATFDTLPTEIRLRIFTYALRNTYASQPLPHSSALNTLTITRTRCSSYQYTPHRLLPAQSMLQHAALLSRVSRTFHREIAGEEMVYKLSTLSFASPGLMAQFIGSLDAGKRGAIRSIKLEVTVNNLRQRLQARHFAALARCPNLKTLELKVAFTAGICENCSREDGAERWIIPERALDVVKTSEALRGIRGVKQLKMALVVKERDRIVHSWFDFEGRRKSKENEQYEKVYEDLKEVVMKPRGKNGV